MPAIQNITTSATYAILAGPGNTFTKSPVVSYHSQAPFVPAFTDNSYSSSSSSSSHNLSAGHYEVHHEGIHSVLPSPIQRPNKASSGIGLGLPSSVIQRTTRAAGGTYATQTHQLHRPLPLVPTRRAPSPQNGITEEERSRLRRSSVAALIGLGIYVPPSPIIGKDSRHINHRSMNNGPPSPPLLPTRRTSPIRITTILDDDITPPIVSIFTPEIPSPFPAPQYSFRNLTAPPAEDLPTPFVNFFSPDLKSTSPAVGSQGLGFFDISGSQQSTITSQPASAENSSSSSSSRSRSQSSDSPRTPFVFQPFTPLPEKYNHPISTPGLGPGLGIQNRNIEPEYHLPSNLLMSPQADDIILDSPFAGFMRQNEYRGRSRQRGAGLGFRGVVYETDSS
ncbi:hypothetical protein QCA50_006094 [Cerrena zonata]|uniref:Uncharacterized protein n=1 Tax=Cerrena zonata TaxID=2478898 RepID=A0AAW0GN88_9APHY